MTFQASFRRLVELFPQVDERLLKAAALEHPDNVNLSVEFVISEVLPHLPSKGLNANNGDVSSIPSTETPCIVEQHDLFLNPSTTTSRISAGNEECTSVLTGKLPDLNDDVPNNVFTSAAVNDEDGSVSEPASDLSLLVHGEMLDDSLEPDASSEKNYDVHNNLYTTIPQAATNFLEDGFAPNSASDHLLLVDGEILDFFEQDASSEKNCDNFDMDGAGTGNRDTSDDYMESLLVDDGSLNITADESQYTTSALSSSQMLNTDFLEDLIGDARQYKNILSEGVESVRCLMQEAEVHEVAAERAKEGTVICVQDILNKVEDLKKMLGHAKEANDMHAGEVYGEKAILATEARELQSRLLYLSEEKDKSLSTIDVMIRDLQARIAAADAVKIEAERERLQKVESAKASLAEQELIMAQVAEESRKLQEEADENSKLREFLIDRGHIMDALQGEIAVVCEDVKLLKERFDKGLSISSSSFLALRSSGASRSLHSSVRSETSTREMSDRASQDNGSSALDIITSAHGTSDRASQEDNGSSVLDMDERGSRDLVNSNHYEEATDEEGSNKGAEPWEETWEILKNESLTPSILL